jgi:pyridoxal phosphate enzyme (YggS family)
MTHDPAKALASVRARIAAAARAAKRDPAAIHLVAVTKTFGPEAIEPALAAGHRLFGENRVQEAKAKWPALRQSYPNTELHLIGSLQSNKAKDAVALFDAIHTVDRPKIAQALAGEMAKQGRRPKLFIEVNTGEEPQKAASAEGAADCYACAARAQLDIRPHVHPAGDERRRAFAFLAKLAGELGLKELSMGMSADFETAIAFGATYVRVGSEIFGPRGRVA